MSTKAVALRSEVGQPRLDVLAAAIREHHHGALDAMRRTVQHAIACGEALAEARSAVPSGLWVTWLDQNTGMDASSARLYIRMHHWREELKLVGIDSISAAQTYLRENKLFVEAARRPLDDGVVLEIRSLREEGLSASQIAKRTGAAATTIKRLVRKPTVTAGRRGLAPVGEREPDAVRVEITDAMGEGMARWLAVRLRQPLTDETRGRATEALRVALNYNRGSDRTQDHTPESRDSRGY